MFSLTSKLFNIRANKPGKPSKDGNIAWQSQTPDEMKTWVDSFFQLLDGYTREAAHQWAQLYAEDGEFVAFGTSFKGQQAIEEHILRFWDRYPGIAHQPLRGYVQHDQNDPSKLIVVVVTRYAATFTGRHHVSGEPVAILEIRDVADGFEILSNKLFLDPEPLTSVLEKTSTTTTHWRNKCSVAHEETVDSQKQK
ncbi:hypothetical protein FE257_007998 [Aspergillus nanangensis]|uniref:PH domain-containing protein n=1 Tax=Aspergillus nanangensis TaxID=2582783 RepID=A0AAD4CM86_ASPNN|nr:hypothetical protein FE257_007998 [Aspergillus nanangensis]